MDFDAHKAAMDKAVAGALGGSITYTPGAGAAVTVQGIFDAAYVSVDAGQAGISSVGPAVWITDWSALPSDPEDDTAARFTVSGVVYRVAEAQRDGGGGVLHLHRV